MPDVGKTEDIYKTIINYLRYRSNRNLTSFRECGFLEQVLIKGCGTVIGKFDTGNGTKASMKRVDKFEIDKGNVKWELHGKKYVHKLEGISQPTTSDLKKTDKRPIILVDMEFNNKTYLNIPIALDLKTTSDFLVNRNLMEIFKVSVNPCQKFLLSEWRAT